MENKNITKNSPLSNKFRALIIEIKDISKKVFLLKIKKYFFSNKSKNNLKNNKLRNNCKLADETNPLE